jgi:CRP-like cAMP-binding protein
MCGGIVSESLVQFLATEGINLPTGVVQRGIASYTLHTDVGSVCIETPLHEKRIGAIHRGPGPRGATGKVWQSFDGHVQRIAQNKGARLVNKRVDGIEWPEGRPQLVTNEGSSEPYDLLAVATGVNSQTLKLFENAGLGYEPPEATKTHIREYKMPRELIDEYLGDSMHVFLLNLPRLEFAALIPKGDYVTVCLLGEDIDKALIDDFLSAPEVKRCLPPSWNADDVSCKCSPRISLRGAAHPYADRLVFIGDCGSTRLYKDGIGSAYRTAKAAAKAAVLHGVSADDFATHYWPACRSIERDNQLGKGIFAVAGAVQKMRFAREVVVRMTVAEQSVDPRSRRMSMVLWDMFTGSAAYRDIIKHAAHPKFLLGLLKASAASAWPYRKRLSSIFVSSVAKTGALGKVYEPGEVIVPQGDLGACMYEIQEGRVEVVREVDGKHMRLAVLEAGDFFGEMALFERIARTATVRAVENARVLTIDKEILLSRIQEEPALAFRMLERLCRRIRTERATAPEEIGAAAHPDLGAVVTRTDEVVAVGDKSDPVTNAPD